MGQISISKGVRTVRVFSKPFLALISAVVFSCAVSACETVDNWTSSKRNDIMVSNTTVEPPAKIEPISATPVAAPLSDSELRGLTTKLSNGSVEVYGLDDDTNTGGDMISLAPVSSEQMPQGVPANNNPSVTVYPLDDFGGAYGGADASAQSPWPAPVQQVNTMTPPPSGGGDAGNGKLVSAAGKDISRVYFPYGSANLDGGDKKVLNDVAETAKFAPVDRVSVEGHASPKSQTSDPIKARILNLKESMNRAYSVSRDLIEQGVPAEKIKTVGYGDTVPAGSEPAQRRVDVVTGAPGY